MKKQLQPLLLGALALFLSVGISLNAQQTAPQNQTPNQQAQPAPPPSAQTPAPPTSDEPAPPPSSQSPPSDQAAPPAQRDQGNSAPAPGQAGQSAPDPQAQPTPPPTGTQAFSGTIVKQGDRYMLQDAASGQTYDLDHQTEVQKYVGKRVKVHGTLDPSGKMIHLQ